MAVSHGSHCESIEPPRLLLSAPYPEAAIQAIANAALSMAPNVAVVSAGGLSTGVLDKAVRSRLIAPDLGLRLARRSRFGTVTSEVATSLELVRLLARASGSQRGQRWWMHQSAKVFDSVVSRRRELRGIGTVLAMPGAAAQTFGKAEQWSARRVFHAVNAHPEAHNARLREAYGGKARLEMLPPNVVSRVTAELALATTVLVPSLLVHEQMRSHGVDPSDLVRVPYGVHPARSGLDGDRIVSPRRRRPLVLFVGQLGYRKGVPYLLDAIRNLPLDLQLVGPRVSRVVLEHLPSNAEYLGPKSNQEVARLMSEADCFVLPSIEDACALVIAEAVAQGTPVITTDQNGASELLSPQDLTVVQSADSRSLRQALSQVTILDPDDRAERKERIATSGSPSTWSEYGRQVVLRCRLLEAPGMGGPGSNERSGRGGAG